MTVTVTGWPWTQVCIVAYSDDLNLMRDASGFADIVRQFSSQIGIQVTDFAFHRRDNLEGEGEQFPQEIVSRLATQSQFELFKELLSSLNRLRRLDYGLVTSMDFADMPWLYFRGFSVPQLGRDLKLNLALWQRQIQDYQKKLRGIYWLNLLGAGQLSVMNDSASSIRSLIDVLGPNNVATLDDEALLFKVPTSAGGPNPFAISVQNLLMDHNMLMLPDVSDIQTILDDSFHRVRPAV